MVHKGPYSLHKNLLIGCDKACPVAFIMTAKPNCIIFWTSAKVSRTTHMISAASWTLLPPQPRKASLKSPLSLPLSPQKGFKNVIGS